MQNFLAILSNSDHYERIKKLYECWYILYLKKPSLPSHLALHIHPEKLRKKLQL